MQRGRLDLCGQLSEGCEVMMSLHAYLYYDISETERNVFTVMLLDRGIVLNSFQYQQRQTKRHKWKNCLEWYRLSSRNSNCERPALTETIKQDGLKAIRDLIVWKEIA